MRKYPRIEIDQLAYDGLQIEAVLQHKTPREIASKAILGYISQKSLSAIDQTNQTTARPQDHKTIEDNTVAVIDKPRKRLFDNPEAIAKIKELWALDPRPSLKEIAKIVNYPKATVADNALKMKKRGELPE